MLITLHLEKGQRWSKQVLGLSLVKIFNSSTFAGFGGEQWWGDPILFFWVLLVVQFVLAKRNISRQ